jgi:hypothetical protein
VIYLTPGEGRVLVLLHGIVSTGAGPFPQLERPRAFVEVVISFVDSTSPAQAGPDRLRQRLLEGGARSAARTASSLFSVSVSESQAGNRSGRSVVT